MNLGLSTGVIYQFVNPLSRRAFDLCREISPVMEINCLASLTADGFALLDLKATDLAGFDYVTIHAPSRDVIYSDDQATHEILGNIEQAAKTLGIKHAVFHPDTIRDWKIFSGYDFRWAVENMDYRKDGYKFADDLEEIFASTDAQFVLDVNHVYTNDRSLNEAAKMADRFHDRLCEVHLSGYEKYHEPLFKTNQMEIIRAVPKCSVPVILESVCRDYDDARREFDFVRKFL